MAWVPVTGPIGLGLSVFSYAGHLRVGRNRDARLLPDSERLPTLLDEEIDALLRS